MDFYSLSDTAIAAELGRRLEQLRLERNITQQTLAEEIGITPKSYRQLIAGGGKLENFVAALRALNVLHQLESFLPETPYSPIEQLKLRGKQRQRARATKAEEFAVREPKLDW
jgi:transcriptional regulator with XRE-family HTH domain